MEKQEANVGDSINSAWGAQIDMGSSHGVGLYHQHMSDGHIYYVNQRYRIIGKFKSYDANEARSQALLVYSEALATNW